MAESDSVKEKKIEKEKRFFDIKYSFYTNGVGTAFNENEIIIEFVQLPTRDDGKIDTVRIFMQPHRFKRNIEIFTRTVNDYEKQYGKIQLKNYGKEIPIKKIIK